MDNKTDKEQTTIRLPEGLKEELQQEAVQKGYTVKDLLVIILKDYFEKAKSQE